MELFIILVIIGIIAALGVPNFFRRVERTRGERAVANTQLIAQALRMYYVKYNQYIADLASITEINQYLDLDIEDPYFDYSVDDSATAPDGDPLQEITITRNSGVYNTNYLYYLIDIDGDPEEWDSSSTWPWTPE